MFFPHSRNTYSPADIFVRMQLYSTDASLNYSFTLSVLQWILSSFNLLTVIALTPRRRSFCIETTSVKGFSFRFLILYTCYPISSTLPDFQALTFAAPVPKSINQIQSNFKQYCTTRQVAQLLQWTSWKTGSLRSNNSSSF